MQLLVSLLIYVLVFGLVAALINYAPIDSKFKQIGVYVVLVIFVISIIGLLTGFGPSNVITIR